MKISGIIKTSLIDYSGLLTTTIFTQGCNFKCPFCHNSELIPGDSKNKEYMDLDYFWEFLQQREGLLDAVTITGGEPTLQSDLVQFITEVKKRNFKVKLDTNGSNPEIIRYLVENQLVDYIALDIKGSPKNYDLYTENKSDVSRVKETINIIKTMDIDYEFRTTVVPGLHDQNEMEKIAKLIDAQNNYVIQNFRSDKTFDSKYEEKTQFSEQKLEQFAKIMKDNGIISKIKN
jgi:pyruvate formate lyase activating enzyme